MMLKPETKTLTEIVENYARELAERVPGARVTIELRTDRKRILFGISDVNPPPLPMSTIADQTRARQREIIARHDRAQARGNAPRPGSRDNHKGPSERAERGAAWRKRNKDAASAGDSE